MTRFTTLILAALATTSVAAQMPDSPTGRMAGAIAELASSSGDEAIERFLAERVGESARGDAMKRELRAMRERCGGGQVRGAMRTGPSSARISLAADGTTCKVAYELEPSEPHRLIALTVDAGDASAAPVGGASGLADERVEGFVAALNAGDADAMLRFYERATTEDFRSRRTEDEDRALYERLRNDLGRVEIERIVRTSPEEVRVTGRSDRMPEPVTFVFRMQDDAIDGLAVEIGGPGGGGGGLELGLPEGVDDATLGRELAEVLEQLARDEMFSGVVLLARNGKPVFHEAYGAANRAAGRANATDTRFDVGSITKLMTRIAVAQLMQAGKLEATDTLRDHLPDYPDRDVAARITVQHLLDHSSGLGDIFGGAWETTPKETLLAPRDFFPLFAGKPLRFEPGQGKAYSNAGFIVLGAIVEAVSGQTYTAYLDRHVFRPAKMKRSGFPSRDGTDAGLAIGYTRHRGGAEPQPNLGMLPIRGCPAGSSSHTAEDLLRLDRALRDGKLLDAAWTAWVYTGVESRRDSARRDWPLGVAGGGPGVSAGFESDGATTAIVLSNLDPPLGEDLALELFRALRKGSGGRREVAPTH